MIRRLSAKNARKSSNQTAFDVVLTEKDGMRNVASDTQHLMPYLWMHLCRMQMVLKCLNI